MYQQLERSNVLLKILWKAEKYNNKLSMTSVPKAYVNNQRNYSAQKKGTFLAYTCTCSCNRYMTYAKWLLVSKYISYIYLPFFTPKPLLDGRWNLFLTMDNMFSHNLCNFKIESFPNYSLQVQGFCELLPQSFIIANYSLQLTKVNTIATNSPDFSELFTKYPIKGYFGTNSSESGDLVS